MANPLQLLDFIKHRILYETLPFLVQFSVTNRCNAQCNYCYAKYYNRNQKELSTEEILHVINDLSKIGTMRINLVGGEPLLRDDIGMIIQHIKSKKMECALTTNGRLVPNKIGELKALDLLCISLDGDKSAMMPIAETAHGNLR